MKKKWYHLILAFIFLGSSLVWAGSPMELIAPGGGDMDLGKNLTRYYASGSKWVVANWDNNRLEAVYLEYYRSLGIIRANKGIKLTQTKPILRTLTCTAMSLDLNKRYYTANQNVVFVYDDDTRLGGDKLEWDQENEKVLVTGKTLITYKTWKISGDSAEGQLKKGLFFITGSVCATDNEITITAGKVTFNRLTEQYRLEDHPVLRKGQNEMTATSFLYDLRTKKVTAEGTVKSQIINEKP